MLINEVKDKLEELRNADSTEQDISLEIRALCAVLESRFMHLKYVNQDE